MTDKELSAFGENLYQAVLETPLAVGSIYALAMAVQSNVAWARLPSQLKVAVFRIAASAINEMVRSSGEPEADGEPEGTEPVTPARSAAARSSTTVDAGAPEDHDPTGPDAVTSEAAASATAA